MASIKPQRLYTSYPYPHTPYLAFLLLSCLQTPTFAQQTIGNQPTAPDDLFATATNGVPPYQGGYGSNADPNGTNGSGSSVSNYYFIILGVIILIFLISGWFLIRRRTRHNAQTRAGGAQATGGTGGDPDARRWTTGRWRFTPARLEEGLNERGEAPPPYIPGQSPPPAIHVDGGVRHPVTGEPIPLEDLSGKPPDYDGHSSSEEDLNLTRPRPTYAAADGSAPRRHLLGSTESSEESTETGLPGASEETQMRRIDEMGHDSMMGAYEMPETNRNEGHMEMPETNRNEGHMEMPEPKSEQTPQDLETIPPKLEGPSQQPPTVSLKHEGGSPLAPM